MKGKKSVGVLGTIGCISSVAASCAKAAPLADDIGRLVVRTGAPETAVVSALDDAARAGGRSADELARALVAAEAPESAFASAARRLRDSDVPEETAVGITCDVLSEAALSPGDLNVETLSTIVFDNLMVAIGGDVLANLATASSIAQDLSDGTADSQLWARVTILKLQHC